MSSQKNEGGDSSKIVGKIAQVEGINVADP